MDDNCSIQLNGELCLESVIKNDKEVKSEIISVEDEEACALYINPILEDESGNRKSRITECSLCFKHVKKSSLRQHMKTHIGLKPYQCNLCNSRFTRKGDVSRHRASMHNTQSPKFKCHSCSKLFYNRQSYLAHLKTHEKQLYYNCELCSSKFAKKEYYADHVKYGNCFVKIENPEIENMYDNELLHLTIEELPESNLLSDLRMFKSEDVTVQSTSTIKKDIDSSIDYIFKNKNTIGLNYNNNEMDSNSVYEMKVSPLNMKCSDSEQVSSAIKTAVHQSEDIIKSIQQSIGCNMTTVQCIHKWDTVGPALSKNSTTELHVKALIEDEMQTFSITLPSEMTVDASTQIGMKAIISLVSNLCSEKGKINGEIEVKLIKQLL